MTAVMRTNTAQCIIYRRKQCSRASMTSLQALTVLPIRDNAHPARLASADSASLGPWDPACVHSSDASLAPCHCCRQSCRLASAQTSGTQVLCLYFNQGIHRQYVVTPMLSSPRESYAKCSLHSVRSHKDWWYKQAAIERTERQSGSHAQVGDVCVFDISMLKAI